MLSPRYLEGVSDELVEIYAQLEADILQDMARRIARLGKVTESTKWQAQLLAETGALKRNVNRFIKKYDPAIQKEIKAIYNDALIKNARADNRIFNEALGHGVSDINAQIMLASIQKTYSDLSRLTITTAYTTEQQFVQQANAAYMQVVSGAFDYDTAMKNACDNLAEKRITSVQYQNKRPVTLSIESAVRMNILTGINQTAATITLNNCEELGCDLVETTAHIGARPSHEEWQGQIFSISGKNPHYRAFSVCGLGTVDGICGINCRHSYYPYFEGLEKHYTQADLDELENEKVEYNGVTYTRYEAEQKLRGMERKIRYYKRQAITRAAGGVDNTSSRVKIGEWQAAARDFTQQTKLERDSVREFIGTADGKQPTSLKSPKNIKVNYEDIKKDYSELVKKYGNYTALIDNATKKEVEVIRRYKEAQKAGKIETDYIKAFNNQKIDTSKLTELMQQQTTQNGRKALRIWSSDTYIDINNYMRNGVLEKPYIKEVANTIKETLKKCEHPACYVRRGADYLYIDGLSGGKDWRKNPALLVGRRLTDKGFLATTPDVKGGFSKDVMLYYKVPEKSQGAYIESISDFSIEKESLFNANTSLVIKEVRTEQIAGHTRYYIIGDME